VKEVHIINPIKTKMTMKKLLLILFLMVATTYTIVAEDEPMEPTCAPNISLNYLDNRGCVVVISPLELESVTYYRIGVMNHGIDEWEFCEWTIYEDELYFYTPDEYTVEAYSLADGKTRSGISAISFVVSEIVNPYYVQLFDFIVDGIYYSITSDSTVAVCKEAEDPSGYWMGEYWYSGESYYSYSGDVVIPSVVEYDGTTYTVTEISYDTFRGCIEVTSVVLPNTITHIGDLAFFMSGIKSIVIPESVTTIGRKAFNACPIESVIVDENNPVYDSRNSCNAIIETASNTLIFWCPSTVIPGSVTSIGEMAGFGSFSKGSLDIPSSVVSIGERAFVDTYLSSVICRRITPPSVPAYSFETEYYDRQTNYVPLFVPAESIEAYRAHEEWGRFTHIVPFIGAGPGDIDGSGTIDVDDVTGIIDMILEGGVPEYADVNGDGSIDIGDISAILNMLLGGH